MAIDCGAAIETPNQFASGAFGVFTWSRSGSNDFYLIRVYAKEIEPRAH